MSPWGVAGPLFPTQGVQLTEFHAFLHSAAISLSTCDVPGPVHGQTAVTPQDSLSALASAVNFRVFFRADLSIYHMLLLIKEDTQASAKFFPNLLKTRDFKHTLALLF